MLKKTGVLKVDRQCKVLLQGGNPTKPSAHFMHNEAAGGRTGSENPSGVTSSGIKRQLALSFQSFQLRDPSSLSKIEGGHPHILRQLFACFAQSSRVRSPEFSRPCHWPHLDFLCWWSNPVWCISYASQAFLVSLSSCRSLQRHRRSETNDKNTVSCGFSTFGHRKFSLPANCPDIRLSGFNRTKKCVCLCKELTWNQYQQQERAAICVFS